ncbi:MAG: nuclease-related domain-containing protein [Wenzhouxiangella sp.]|jgi:hypothetical protein|nr:nuclease-related domain-containing protein [Wenzhouxiangella sp.]
MADLRFIQPYKALDQHRSEMRQAARLRRNRVAAAFVAGIVLSAAGYWVAPPLAVISAGIAVLAVFFSAITGGSSVPASALTGAEGEVRVLQELEKLPADHVVFNQVQVPDETVASGRREIDFLVVAPSGVHCIEVKNTAGLIYVRPEEKQWPLAHKAGCGGRPGWNAIPNPLIQVAAQTEALDRWLLRHNLMCTVSPILVFARSEVGLRDRDLAAIPVLTAAELTDHLAGLEPLTSLNRGGVMRALAEASGREPAKLA